MRTITSRDLKQNPSEVYRRVLESGEEHVITSHGKSVGVKLVPDHPGPQRWVPAATLRAGLARLPHENVEEFLRDLEALRDAEPLRDPWDDAE
ncbi:type II toxin-antitoxin system Phd/YefM family antitoxin [Agromyces sp. H66]|uniref:type II toxin-antitoxin system Phd/YefM family antitoxin n=1 Tax=Agromyces sp. H66 TaxID=2529859 RepID=UPI0010AA10AA|nr:type II toxin-antitoxin system Phd/YefM family antitoxin [Agromyces sp. H66]